MTEPMFAVIDLPQFSLQAALRHEPELWTKPVALVDPERTTPVVMDLTPAARGSGVSPGLTATQALARCAAVVIRRRVPSHEVAAAAVVLQCAHGFSPWVEATLPGMWTLGLQGLAVLKNTGNEEHLAWAARLRAALSGQGLTARIGLGGTPNLARHAARWTEGVEIVTEPSGFVRGLPLAALEPSSDALNVLGQWGVRTVGELLALGQEALVDRLGLEALALLAAASPAVTRPLHVVSPPEVFEELFEFEHEIETAEPLLFLLRRFVDQLSRRLELAGRVAELLTLRLRLVSGEVVERLLRVPEPTRRPEVWFRMLQTLLDSLRTATAVVAVQLHVSPVEPRQKQFGLFEAGLRDPLQFHETLARLAALVGADRVGTPVREDSHRPDAIRMVPPELVLAAPVVSLVGAALAPVPIRRLRPAVPADVELGRVAVPGQAVDVAAAPPCVPVAVRCPVAHGGVRTAAGPWRSDGGWWEPGGWQREEWDVAVGPTLVLRLVQQPGGWSVEGILD